MHAHDDIRIGTLVPAHDRTPELIEQLLPHGFETFQISFGRSVGAFDLAGLADRVGRVLAASSGMATIEPTPSQALAPRSFAPARAQGHTPHRRRQYGADGGGGHRLRALGAAAHLLRPLTDQP